MTTPPPPHPWLPPELIARQVGVDIDADGWPSVEDARVAAAGHVERVRPDLWVTTYLADGVTVDQVTYTPTDSVVHGAALLTSRLLARKASPAGLANFSEFGPAPIARLDVDVERLLGLGRYANPTVG